MSKKQRKMQEFTSRPSPRHSGPKTPGGTGANSEPSGSSSETDSHAEILQEIKQMRSEITNKIDSLDIKMNLMQAHVDHVTESLRGAEGRIAGAEARIDPMERTLADLQNALDGTRARLADQEGRNRRNNVRVIGLPEGTERSPVEPFMEGLLKELFPEARFSPMYVVERAHRALQRRPPPGAPPRPLILRFLNYRDRDILLTAAREKGETHYQGARVSFYQDFTVEVQTARRAFLEVKRQLRDKGIRYAMLFPSKLRVISKGKTYFFTDHDAAMSFAREAPSELEQVDQNLQHAPAD